MGLALGVARAAGEAGDVPIGAVLVAGDGTVPVSYTYLTLPTKSIV